MKLRYGIIASAVLLGVWLLYFINAGVTLLSLSGILVWGICSALLIWLCSKVQPSDDAILLAHSDKFFRTEIRGLIESEKSLNTKESVFESFNDEKMMGIYNEVRDKFQQNKHGVVRYIEAFDYHCGGQEFTIKEVRRLVTTNKNLVIQLNKLAERVISLEVSYTDVEDAELNDLIASLQELSGR